MNAYKKSLHQAELGVNSTNTVMCCFKDTIILGSNELLIPTWILQPLNPSIHSTHLLSTFMSVDDTEGKHMILIVKGLTS